jgi:hypothetical protein
MDSQFFIVLACFDGGLPRQCALTVPERPGYSTESFHCGAHAVMESITWLQEMVEIVKNRWIVRRIRPLALRQPRTEEVL